MRKTLIISLVILLFGCTKEINSGSVNTCSINKIQTGNLAADTYLPLTKGTWWNYSIKTDSDSPDESKLTVTKQQKKINGKNYQVVTSGTGKHVDTVYYAQDQHDYYIYTYSATSDADNVNLEILFLKDNAAVGDTWLLPAGSANGFALKCYGKIIEKDININVAGTVYKHVIHTYIEMRKPFFFTYIVVNKQNFYVAENIGVVKNVSEILLPSKSTSTTNITAYKIK